MRPHPADSHSPETLPRCRNLVLDEGVLREPTQDDQSIALWLPGERRDGFQLWERVSSVPRTEFTVEPGVRAVAASLVRAKQPVRGFLGRLLGGGRATAESRSWLLPNGAAAEQFGERQSELILVWSEDESGRLDEQWVRSRWPGSARRQKIGNGLYLVSTAGRPVSGDVEEQVRSPGCPRALAERLLAAARQAGDRRKEASALADLGAIFLQEGDARRAAALLEEALAVVRSLGDRAREGEMLGDLGMAVLVAGDPRAAAELFGQELARARDAGNRYAEKAALEHLGLAHVKQKDAARALAAFEEALALARAAGDRKHEADLLWLAAIQHAELGRGDAAVAHAKAAVDLLGQVGNPQAAWFAEHLRKYQTGETGNNGRAGREAPEPAATAAGFWGGSFIASAWTGLPAPYPPPQAVSGPGFLRMALSAAKSMARFLGSGMKTASPADLQGRLQTCAACEHHTGLRCRLCGCFTNVKARMAHEECPIGKWPGGKTAK
jgi:tetratricopeptide (TPR) repeat protein